MIRTTWLGVLVAWVGALSPLAWGQQALPQLKRVDPKQTARIACVGDSITFGSGIPGRETNSYPAVLDRLLPPMFEVRNLGVSGATLLRKGDRPYWDTPQFKEIAEFGPRLIVLLLGTNDSKPQNWAHRGDFEADLKAMLDYFGKLETPPVVLLGLPLPVYGDRFGIRGKVVQEEIIPVLKKVAGERGLRVIDLNAALSGHPEWFPDQVHPDAAGASLMAKTVLEAIRSPKH